MNQTEEVIQTMEDCGGFATFGQLYQKVRLSNWKTKTPQASIRRIVQNSDYFFKIEPGLWALNSYKNKLPAHIFQTGKSAKNKIQSEHYYYQGLLLEIGNLRNYKTFVPNQDKNRKFLDTNLGSLRTLPSIYKFGYEIFIKHAQTIDVSWFNSRKMPDYFFEVEHSTQMERSLIKFNELTDFNANFVIVSNRSRKKEFEEKIQLKTFELIKHRVKFFGYEEVSRLHSLQITESTSPLFQNHMRTI